MFNSLKPRRRPSRRQTALNRKKIQFDGARFERDIEAKARARRTNRTGGARRLKSRRFEGNIEKFGPDLSIKYIISFGCLVAACAGYASEPDSGLPQFDQVYNLLRTNLHGADPAQLDGAAIKGLLAQFHSKAMLVSAQTSNRPSAAVAPLGKTAIFDDSYVYFRVARVEGGLARSLMAAYRQLSRTNKSRIKGAVLDLRFAGGDDYACAGAVADCFLNSDQPLLDWGAGTARATTKTDSIAVPLAVLVNSQTSEAAEALAAALREGNAGLLIGGKTAGQASVFKDFPLANGDKLRIAVGQIKLGDGTAFAGGVEPDIAVNTSAADEKSYLQDPYKAAGTAKNDPKGAAAGRSATNFASFRRYNEAELIREHRDGSDLEEEFSPTPTDADAPSAPAESAPLVTDPALARGLDLLKGLAVVQEGHPG